MSNKERYVRNAEENSLVRSVILRIHSALRTARRRIEGKAELMTSREAVSIAVGYSLLTSTKRTASVVEVVQHKTKESVYCLTTDNGYFGLHDGPVVSNCDAFGYPIAYEFPINRPVADDIAFNTH